MSIPLEPHGKAQSSKIFLSFPPKIKGALIFYLLGNPAGTAYLSVRDGKLSNAVRLLEFRPRKVAVHTFLHLGGPKLLCTDGLRAGTIESHNFFVLGPILVKFHIRTRLIDGFPTIFRTCSGVLRHVSEGKIRSQTSRYPRVMKLFTNHLNGS